jgi:glycerate kinase
MDILIAPDSFKENLTAMEVATNLEKGLKSANSRFEIKKLPMADGGEGTVWALVKATKGVLCKKKVTGPLGNKIEAEYGILGDGTTAVIEMAAASGLHLVPEERRNPANTTTYGTGELIKTVLDQECDRLIIGIGGSATNDCGIGMVQALGGRFLDQDGKEVDYGGGNLINVDSVDLSKLDSRIKNTEIEVACDVDNPLYGENGAAYVYGPQKGASPKQVKKLDMGLKNIAQVIQKDLKLNITSTPGAGAAGGLGAGLMVFLDAKLKKGIDIVLEASKIKEKLENIDVVITGEGKIDYQTINGKTPVGVAGIAKESSIFVIGVAGTLGKGAEKVYAYGIDALFSIVDSPMTLQEAFSKSDDLLVDLGKNIGRLLDLKSN